MKNISLLTCISWFLVSCASNYQGQSPDFHSPSSRIKQEINTSLFESDKSALSQDAVDKLLSGKINSRDSLRVAIFKVRGSESNIFKYSYNYPRDEEFIDLEQEYFETISEPLKKNKKVLWTKPLPSILTPVNISLPNLRESAVRMQADLLVIYSVQSDIFTEINLVAKNEVKAYSTVEMIVFDTKTGIVPISEVKTTKIIEKQLKEDVDVSETRKRAQKKAIIEALKIVSSNCSENIKSN